MDSTTAPWPQGIGLVKPMESAGPLMERKPRPQKEQALNCPRCHSTNTKFCYYNNYSLTQPRYFCKTCRRYWTEGGSLRNVPVGGGSRKNKRSASSSPSPSSSSKKVLDHHHHHNFPLSASQNPKIHEGQDLNLAYPQNNNNNNDHYNPITNFVHHQDSNLSAMELLKSRGLSCFMAPMAAASDSSTIYPSGYHMQEFKPTINFSMEGFEGNFGGLQGVQENNNNSSARLFFPSTSELDHQQNRGQGGDSNSYWNGMLGGGSW